MFKKVLKYETSVVQLSSGEMTATVHHDTDGVSRLITSTLWASPASPDRCVLKINDNYHYVELYDEDFVGWALRVGGRATALAGLTMLTTPPVELTSPKRKLLFYPNGGALVEYAQNVSYSGVIGNVGVTTDCTPNQFDGDYPDLFLQQWMMTSDDVVYVIKADGLVVQATSETVMDKGSDLPTEVVPVVLRKHVSPIITEEWNGVFNETDLWFDCDSTEQLTVLRKFPEFNNVVRGVKYDLITSYDTIRLVCADFVIDLTIVCED